MMPAGTELQSLDTSLCCCAAPLTFPRRPALSGGVRHVQAAPVGGGGTCNKGGRTWHRHTMQEKPGNLAKVRLVYRCNGVTDRGKGRHLAQGATECACHAPLYAVTPKDAPGKVAHFA